MTIAFLPFLLGLSQGLLHAAGPDHCVAMATLSTLPGRTTRSAFSIALRFAIGHAVVLGSLATACLFAGIGLSEAFETWAEIGGGVLLVGLAAAALFFPGAFAHGHPHLGNHGPDHLHPRVPAAAGALLALSGVRSLMLALPPLLVGGSMSLHSLGYLPGFALGVFLGMGAFGLLLAAGIGRFGHRAGDRLHRAAALSSGVLGVAWIAVRL